MRSWPLLLLLIGCTDPPASTAPALVDAGSGESLIVPNAWRLLSPDEDPMAAQRPQGAVCSPSGYYTERDQLEVLTERCQYMAAEQPLRETLPTGSRVQVHWSHGSLRIPDGGVGQGHFSLYLGDMALSERQVPIPSDAGVYTDEVAIEQDVPADVFIDPSPIQDLLAGRRSTVNAIDELGRIYLQLPE